MNQYVEPVSKTELKERIGYLIKEMCLFNKYMFISSYMESDIQ